MLPFPPNLTARPYARVGYHATILVLGDIAILAKNLEPRGELIPFKPAINPAAAWAASLVCIGNFPSMCGTVIIDVVNRKNRLVALAARGTNSSVVLKNFHSAFAIRLAHPFFRMRLSVFVAFIVLPVICIIACATNIGGAAFPH